MRKVMTFIVAAFLPAMYIAAQESVAMDWLRASRNPVTASLAGAGSASSVQGTAFSFLQNPALAPLEETTLGAAVSMNMTPSGEGHSNGLAAGAAWRLGKFSVHAGYASMRYPETALSSDGGGAAGTFKPSNMIIGGGLGFAFTDYLSLGANIRFAKEQLSSKVVVSGINADLAALFKMGGLGVSAGVYSLGPKVKSSGNRTYALPASAKIGASYDLAFGESVIGFVADADYYFNANLGAAAGVSYALKDMVFVRAGFAYGSLKDDFTAAPVPTHFSFGAGLKLYGAQLDLCAKIIPDAGTAICGSLSYSF